MNNKIFSFIASMLCFVLFIDSNFNSLLVHADSDYEIKYIDAVIEGKHERIPVLQQNGNLYLSSESLSNYTDFYYDKIKRKFIHDRASENNGFREIWVNESSKLHIVSCLSAIPSVQHTLEIPEIIVFDTDEYFSIPEILPVLNSNVNIVNHELHIERIPYSLTNIFSSFDLHDFLYNTYDDKDILGLSYDKVLTGYSYFFSSLVNFKWKRLINIGGKNLGKVDDYTEIFNSFLNEDEAYLKAMDNGTDYNTSLVKYLKNDDNDIINYALESLSQSADISGELHQQMLELYPTIDSYTNEFTNIEALGKTATGVDLLLKLCSYATVYHNHIEDHYQMLNAVYGATDNANGLLLYSSNDEAKIAAERIYTRYSADKTKSTASYIGQSVADIVVNKAPEFVGAAANSAAISWAGAGALIAKGVFIYTDFNIYNIAEKAQYLGHYNHLMETGLAQFQQYSSNANMSKSQMEKIRLSAIMTLLSSRSSYQVMIYSQEQVGNETSIWQKKIDQIDELLKQLYQANNGCFADSVEYINQKIKELKAEISSITLSDDPVNGLNISATVFAQPYQTTDNSHSAPMYAESSSNSKLLTTIPNGTIVTIISVPDNYQDGEPDHLMVLVDYNGQQGYINSLCLRCDPSIDISLYSQEQILDLGKILFNECEYFSELPISFASLLDYTLSDEYDSIYQKMLPAGLSISKLKEEFYKYFSSTESIHEESFSEKDGFLWVATGYGGLIWLDHFEVKSVKSVSKTEIVYEVDEIINPNFYEFYAPINTFEFKILNENGKWMLTIPDRAPEQPSSQYTSQTYEDIYGSLVFDGVNDQKGLFGHEDYVSQPTGYRIHQYFLEDINNDGIKELILEVTVSGTDETFRECYTYKDGSVQWCGIYTDIYMIKDCYLASDGNGLVVISWGGWSEDNHVYAFHYWRLWDIKERDHLIPYIGDFPEIGDFHTDTVEMHVPYATIPDNIRSKLGKKLVAYSPVDRSPLKESFSSTSSSEKSASISSVSDKYTSIQGIVNTEKSDLMLRRLPDANDKTNVISKIPKGTKIALLLPFKSYFARDDGDQTSWYYADYNGKTGFVSAKYIKETADRVGMTDEQITSVAKLLYLSAMNAESWSYSNCFDYSIESYIGCPDSYPHSNEFRYYPISGIQTTADWYAQIHKQFSAKYDDDRAFNEGGLKALIQSNDSYPPYYWNNNGRWYLLDAIFRKGDIPLDIAYSEPFRVVHLTKQKESGNEVFFSGYLDYSQGDSAWVYDGGIDNIDNFSICFEDGSWKVGFF
ncbi:MAG: SH3 domain-containing protein [Oscillospiraceae bacterium]|nr:SH3 domain-containing protein [Oscillospiraceae bacterium]